MKNNSLLFLFALCIGLFFGACNEPENNENTTPPQDTTQDTTAQLPPKPVLPEASTELTQMALFLAGLEPTLSIPAIDSLKEKFEWANHKEFFSATWQTLDTGQLKKIDRWAEKELKDVRPLGDQVFYPFSGPDFLYAHVMFPGKSKYLMAGLEPVGEVPVAENLINKNLNLGMRGLQLSLNDILNLSFFKTNDMRAEFESTPIKGVIPILMVFLARTDHSIIDITHLAIDENGKLVPREEGANPFPGLPAVRVRFKANQDPQKVQEIIYFSGNIANSGLETTMFVLDFIRDEMDKPVGYLKSATYLMHKDYFNLIRDIFLDECVAVVEDDSGVPIRYLPEDQWEVRLYGAYMTPISLFSNWYQKDLQVEYDKPNAPIKALDFGIGYRYTIGQSNLLVAIKKTGSADKNKPAAQEDMKPAEKTEELKKTPNPKNKVK